MTALSFTEAVGSYQLLRQSSGGPCWRHGRKSTVRLIHVVSPRSIHSSVRAVLAPSIVLEKRLRTHLNGWAEQDNHPDVVGRFYEIGQIGFS